MNYLKNSPQPKTMIFTILSQLERKIFIGETDFVEF